MTEPYVRPDVRQFLDWLNALPGPKTYEAGPVEARRMILASRHVADAPTGELAVIRDLSCPGPGGEIALRLFDARETREAGAALPVLPRRRLRVRRSRHARAVLRRDGARSSTCRCSRSTTGSRPNIPGRPGVEDAIAAARWAAASPEALGREVTGLVTLRRQRRRQFRDRRQPRAARRAGGGAGARAMADLSGRRSRQGLSEQGGFRRGLYADPGRAWTGSRNAIAPTSRTGAMRRW